MGKLGKADDHGGHAKPCQAGGDCSRYNLFPENKALNNGKHKALEIKLGKLHKAGQLDGPVRMRYTKPDPATGRPEGFDITYKVKGEAEPKVVPFVNEKPGP